MGFGKPIQIRDRIRLPEQRNDSFVGGPQHSSGAAGCKMPLIKWNVSSGAMLSPNVAPRDEAVPTRPTLRCYRIAPS